MEFFNAVMYLRVAGERRFRSTNEAGQADTLLNSFAKNHNCGDRVEEGTKSYRVEAGVRAESPDVGALFDGNQCWGDKVGAEAKSCRAEVGAGGN